MPAVKGTLLCDSQSQVTLHSMAAAAPFFPSNHTDHSGWLVAVTITFLIYSIFGVGATIANRLRMGALKFHDWFIVAALVFQFVQAIVLIRAAVNGLGKHQLILSKPVVDTFHKVWIALLGEKTMLTRSRNSLLRISCRS